ncbi:MAG: hypothetical protein ACI86M_003992 [Saprospiraceae bacterium]|jgi:hypothetical protein
MNRIIQFTFLLLFVVSYANGQVIISEYSASNLSTYLDDYGAYDDWIELHNESDMAVDISGWYISDKSSKPTKYQFPEGTLISPNGYKIVVCSGRDLQQTTEIHTNFKLSQTEQKDIILLSNAAEEEQDFTELIITNAGHSVSRMEGEWMIDKSPTPNADNSPEYTRYASVPSILLEAGFYEDTVTVEIINNEENSVLRYTTDGNRVRPSSPIYENPLTVGATSVVKARAYSNDDLVWPSRMDFSTYFINETFTLPVFSVAADGVQDLANNMDGMEGFSRPIGSVEYFNVDQERESVSYGELNRHGQDSWALNHRSLDYICRDEMGYTKAIKAQLFPQKSRDEFQRLMFRASGDDNYPAIQGQTHAGSAHVRDEYVHSLALEGGMELDVRTPRRAILFLNGDYWGVYGLREKIADHDYIKEYYDQGKYDIQFNSTWGNFLQRYGGQAAGDDWLALQDFILSNNMGDETNYRYVDSLLNTTSLIDWVLINTNTVAADWLQWNTGWWRGMDPDGKHKKWGYIVWDLDATFDYYINYTGVPNTDPDAVPCDIEALFQWVDECQQNVIFLRLLDQNAEFRELYYQRYADMMNTVFTCENMLSTLDRMVAEIEPEMPRQVERWAVPGSNDSMDEWETNVARLRGFIEERCTLLDDGALECYTELSGPYEITLLTEPAEVGEIDFNSLDIEAFPWVGNYFGGMKNKIKAKVFNAFEDDYVFSHWESKSGNVIFPDVTSRKADIELTSNDTLVAVFDIISGVEDLFEEKGFSLYPNPASDVMQLNYNIDQSSDVQISMIDAKGRAVIISSETAVSAGYKTLSIDLQQHNLVSGLYVLNIRLNNESINRKVTVIR